jgi:hypothetical protein
MTILLDEFSDSIVFYFESIFGKYVEDPEGESFA